MNRNEESLNAIFSSRIVKSSADKETIKKEIENEFWDVLNFVDPMDHYTGVDTSVERMESWEEEVAERYGVDPLVINEITQEITTDAMDKAVKEEEWARKNLNDDEFYKWMTGELDISDRINSSKKSIKSSFTSEEIEDGLDSVGIPNIEDFININFDINKEDIPYFALGWNNSVKKNAKDIVSVEYGPDYNTVDGTYLVTYKNGSTEIYGWEYGGHTLKKMRSRKTVKSGADYSGENKAKMLNDMAKSMSYENNPDYKRFMNDIDNKNGVYKELIDFAHDKDTKEYLELGDDYFTECVETALAKICDWEFDSNFISRMKKYAPEGYKDIVEKSVQLVKDNLK